MAKQKENENFQSNGDVCKTNSGSRIIGGWFSVFKYKGAEVLDLDNEVVDMESYNDVFIDFSINHRVANFDHDGVVKGHLIDNILIDSEEMAKMIVSEITGMKKEDIPIVKLGHFGSFQITEQNDYDEAIKNKLMFSIEGLCSREEILEDE